MSGVRERRCRHESGSRRCGRTAGPGSVLCWEHERASTGLAPPAPAAAGTGAGEARRLADEIRREVRKVSGTNGSERDLGGRLAEFKDRLRGLGRAFPLTGWSPFERARELLTSDLFDVAAWRGMLAIALTQAELTLEEGKRRLKGEYEVDEFGFDEAYLERARPFLLFLYRHWFRVEAKGIGHVPDEGRALLVANHSGVLPYDGAMVATAIWEEHRAPRYLRALYWEGLGHLPFLSTLLHRTGQVVSCPENSELLLEKDQLVIVFPEGVRGIGKRFKDRYRLQGFGRGEFAKSAIRTGAPIVPVSVIGAEEIHPLFWKSPLLGKFFGLPFVPFTLTFPWLGPLGMIPLPAKWRIAFDEPLETASYGRDRADDFVLVSKLALEVKNRIEGNILRELRDRRGVFR